MRGRFSVNMIFDLLFDRSDGADGLQLYSAMTTVVLKKDCKFICLQRKSISEK